MPRATLDKPKPFDYLVMIGAPLLFMAIAVWGLRSLAGADVPQTAIHRLREGVVKPGMTREEVLRLVGRPKAEIQNESGRTTFRYMHGVWDTQSATFREDDAYVDFDASGRVSSVAFETRTPEPPK